MVVELTEREREILKHLRSGMLDKEIAAELHISIHTVRGHVRTISRLLGVRTRFQLGATHVKRRI